MLQQTRKTIIPRKREINKRKETKEIKERKQREAQKGKPNRNKKEEVEANNKDH